MRVTATLTLSSRQKLERARAAAAQLVRLSTAQKNELLVRIADALDSSTSQILRANQEDMERSQLSAAIRDRLLLNPQRISEMVEAARDVAALPDPVNETLQEWTRPNGLLIRKVCVPLGVVGIVYESRPNVTVDATVLCLKTGNVTVLRGGSEAVNSNLALGKVIGMGLKEAGLPEAVVSVIGVADRAAVKAMLKLDQYIDIIIPRGGNGLIRAVVEMSTIPVIRHDIGNCHVYVDKAADLKMAQDIA